MAYGKWLYICNVHLSLYVFTESLIRSALNSTNLIHIAKITQSFQLLFKYALIAHNSLAVNEIHTTNLEDYTEFFFSRNLRYDYSVVQLLV